MDTGKLIYNVLACSLGGAFIAWILGVRGFLGFFAFLLIYTLVACYGIEDAKY